MAPVPLIVSTQSASVQVSLLPHVPEVGPMPSDVSSAKEEQQANSTTISIAANVKKERFFIKQKGVGTLESAAASRFFAALFETAGQLTYVYALSGNGIAAAPVIASYCVASMVFGRIFLREKLSWKQYGAIALVVAGIVIMGILEGLGEG